MESPGDQPKTRILGSMLVAFIVSNADWETGPARRGQFMVAQIPGLQHILPRFTIPSK